MSPAFLIFILFAVVTLIVYSTASLIKTEKNKMENLFLNLSKEGSANNLIFCSQEMLHNKVIGIDGIHRKVMILEEINHKYNASILSLDEVQNCELKKNYESLNMREHKRFGIKKMLQKIELQFEFKNDAQPASITFYDRAVNSGKEIVLMKAKAEYWNVMLSKMLTRKEVKAKAA